MNDSTPPPGTPGTPQGPAPGRPLDRFFSWLRGLGIVRGDDRWFAGVAGGIAAKAGIDPLIVRGLFVVLAVLGGPGILLYLVGWLLLPDSAGRIHFEDLIRGRASAGTTVTIVILGVLLVVPAFFWLLPMLFAGPWSWDVWNAVPGFDWVSPTLSAIWFFVLLPALIVWLIVWISRGGLRNGGAGGAARGPAEGGAARAAPAPGHAQQSAAAGAAGAASAWRTDGSAQEPTGFADRTRAFADQAEGVAGRVGEQANEWGEQATAWGRKVREEARQWEQTGRAYHEAHRLGAAHTVLTLALALLAAGGAAAWALSLSASGDLVLMAGLLAAVGVLAVSLIVAGIRGRQSGWVGFLSFIGVIALIFAPFSTVLPGQTRFMPFGAYAAQASDHDADQGVVIIAGNAKIDLTELDRRSDPRAIEVWLLAGSATVELPSTHPVRVRMDLLAGNIREYRSDDVLQQNGAFLSRTVGANLDDVEAEEITEVRVRILAGNIRVQGVDGLAAPAGMDADPAHQYELEPEAAR